VVAVKRIIVASATVGVVAVVGASVLLARSEQPRGSGTHPQLLTDPYVNVVYPQEWKTTLEAASTQAVFTLMIPNTVLANAANPVAVYVWPQGQAVAIDFPAPVMSSQSPVRQEYLEIYEAPWPGGDPLTAFQADIAADPVVGKDIYYLGPSGTVPALGVTARSPSDMDQANAAFLQFVNSGIEVQVSGGESLQDLIDIANSMLQ
jgi:hypothetical protein